MFDWLQNLHSEEGIRQIVQAGGLLLLIAIVFAETGILAGFFLPGDSLLITAGVLCAVNPATPDAAPILNLWAVLGGLFAATLAGDFVNYRIGAFTGGRIWNRPDGRFFKRRYLEEAHAFYAKRGGWAVLVGRFIPIVRTFMPFVAGMARMPYWRFQCWDFAGALLWVGTLVPIGYVLGRNETMRANLHYLILAVIALSFVPVAIAALVRWRDRRRSA